MKQINKTAACKLYEQGKPFIIVPANMRPDSVMAIKVQNGILGHENFDNFYNEFCYYNCGNSEVGRYPRFYVED